MRITSSLRTIELENFNDIEDLPLNLKPLAEQIFEMTPRKDFPPNEIHQIFRGVVDKVQEQDEQREIFEIILQDLERGQTACMSLILGQIRDGKEGLVDAIRKYGNEHLSTVSTQICFSAEETVLQQLVCKIEEFLPEIAGQLKELYKELPDSEQLSRLNDMSLDDLILQLVTWHEIVGKREIEDDIKRGLLTVERLAETKERLAENKKRLDRKSLVSSRIDCNESLSTTSSPICFLDEEPLPRVHIDMEVLQQTGCKEGTALHRLVCKIEEFLPEIAGQLKELYKEMPDSEQILHLNCNELEVLALQLVTWHEMVEGSREVGDDIKRGLLMVERLAEKKEGLKDMVFGDASHHIYVLVATAKIPQKHMRFTLYGTLFARFSEFVGEGSSDITTKLSLLFQNYTADEWLEAYNAIQSLFVRRTVAENRRTLEQMLRNPFIEYIQQVIGIELARASKPQDGPVALFLHFLRDKGIRRSDIERIEKLLDHESFRHSKHMLKMLNDMMIDWEGFGVHAIERFIEEPTLFEGAMKIYSGDDGQQGAVQEKKQSQPEPVQAEDFSAKLIDHPHLLGLLRGICLKAHTYPDLSYLSSLSLEELVIHLQTCLSLIASSPMASIELYERLLNIKDLPARHKRIEGDRDYLHLHIMVATQRMSEQEIEYAANLFFMYAAGSIREDQEKLDRIALFCSEGNLKDLEAICGVLSKEEPIVRLETPLQKALKFVPEERQKSILEALPEGFEALDPTVQKGVLDILIFCRDSLKACAERLIVIMQKTPHPHLLVALINYYVPMRVWSQVILSMPREFDDYSYEVQKQLVIAKYAETA